MQVFGQTDEAFLSYFSQALAQLHALPRGIAQLHALCIHNAYNVYTERTLGLDSLN